MLSKNIEIFKKWKYLYAVLSAFYQELKSFQVRNRENDTSKYMSKNILNRSVCMSSLLPVDILYMLGEVFEEMIDSLVQSLLGMISVFEDM